MKYLVPILACGSMLLTASLAQAEPDDPGQQVSSDTAQPTSDNTSDPKTVEELLKMYKDLQNRVETLEKQHQIDQQKLRDIQSQDKSQTTTTPNSAAQKGNPDQRLTLRDIHEAAAAARAAEVNILPQGNGAARTLGQGNLYNPSITFFGDFGVSVSPNAHNDKTTNRFNLREFELDARAAIAPFADGIFIGTYGEEIADNGSGGVDIGTVTDVEEGYIDFHTLPFDLTAKVGKFRNAFGVSNGLHTHDTPQVDRPLALQEFLGPEGISTTGASLSWLVPNPADEFIELTTQFINADGGGESPILGGPNADNPAYLAHLKWFTDVGDYGSFELGGTYLYTHTAADSSFDANVFGLDATLKLPDPDAPDLRSFLLQGELFSAQNDIFDPVTSTGSRNSSLGAYLFGQWQFDKNWYAGIRGDYSEFPNSDIYGTSDYEWAVSPYITWYPAEFLRTRLEYQHKEILAGANSDSKDELMLQFTFVIGAHPPHPYWVNK